MSTILALLKREEESVGGFGMDQNKRPAGTDIGQTRFS